MPRRRVALVLALSLAAFAGLRGPVLAARRAAKRGAVSLDAGQEADASYGGGRAGLPPRVGFCADGLPVQGEAGPRDPAWDRLARRHLAQFALAPVVVVPVLGQPSGLQREPSEPERRAKLSRLEVVLVEASEGSGCWNGAVEAGFAPVSRLGPAAVFERKGE